MIKENSLKFYVSCEDAGQRLDKFIATSVPELSRSRIQDLIENAHVVVQPERRVGPSTKTKIGDVYILEIPEAKPAIPVPQKINMEIVYEDEDLLVINKPAGLVVHPAPGHVDHTLVNGILAHCGDQLSGIGGVRRPGIVHRLDKDTSGLMVVAKNDNAHHYLSAQFESRSLSRTYHALVWGHVHPKEGQIQTYIGRSPYNRQKMAVVQRGGKEAVTHYKTVKTFTCTKNLSTSISLVECRLKTGRTHQIRVHLSHMGHSILGDPLYGHPPKGARHHWPLDLLTISRQILHACHLEFIHPRTKSVMRFDSPYPEDIANIIICIENYI